MVGQFNPFRNGVDLSGNLAEKAAGEADLSWLLEVNLSWDTKFALIITHDGLVNCGFNCFDSFHIVLDVNSHRD